MAKEKASIPKTKTFTTKSHTDNYYKKKLVNRFWMTLNYLSIPLANALIYAFAIYCETNLYKYFLSTLEGETQKFASIKFITDYFQTGIILVSLVGFLLHSGYSLYGQLQVERQFSKEEN